MLETNELAIKQLALIKAYRLRAHMFVPANMPAAPKPLNTRPTMNTGDVGAAADSTEPIAKTNSDAM